MTGTRGLPRGVWVIVVFHVLSLLLWLFGQTGAVLSYDTVAAWGLQEPRAALGFLIGGSLGSRDVYDLTGSPPPARPEPLREGS